MQGRSFGNPPVNVGDEINVQIEAVGEKGDGVAKKDGFVLFVPGAKEGQNVKVKVTRVLKKVGFAEIIGEGASQEEAEPAEESQDQGARAPQEEAQEEAAPEESPEDTEDFGEELEEEKKQE